MNLNWTFTVIGLVFYATICQSRSIIGRRSLFDVGGIRNYYKGEKDKAENMVILLDTLGKGNIFRFLDTLR